MARSRERAPIFIIGGGRSGTSVLRAMLNAHPQIYLLQESHFYPWTLKPGLRGGTKFSLERFLQSFSFAWLNLDPRSLRERFDDDLSHGQHGDAYEWIMREVASRLGKERWGDKTPINSFYLPLVFEAFPDARVIEMIRDPRDMTLSHLSMPFALSTSLLWATVGRNGICNATTDFRDQLLTVRLEDLLSEPSITMNRVLDYVGEPWHDAVLEHWSHVPEDDPPYPWVLSANEPLRPYRARWPDDLSPAWIRMIEWRYREWMETWGYEVATLSKEPTLRERIRAIRRDVPESVRFLWRAFRVVRRIFSHSPTTPEEGLSLVLSLNPGALEANPNWELPLPPKAVR